MQILLIDDDDVTNYINKRIIRNVDPEAQITILNNGLEALDYFRQNLPGKELFPDVILLDITMPDMDGWEFLEEIEKEGIKLPEHSRMYMLTSSVFPDDINKANSNKFITQFYSKPLDNAKLKEMLR